VILKDSCLFCSQLQLLFEQIKALSQLESVRNLTVISSFLLKKIQFGNKHPVLPHTIMLACVYAVRIFNNIIHHEEATFRQSSCSLPCTQQPVINLCLESDEFSPHPHLLFLKDVLILFSHLLVCLPKWLLPWRFLDCNFSAFVILLI